MTDRYDHRELRRLRTEVASLRAQLRALGGKGDAPDWPAIGGAWDDRLLADHNYPVSPQQNNRCSSLGDGCARRLYYERIGADKKPMQVHVCGIFHTGNEIEESVKRSLSLLGYCFERSQETVEYRIGDELLFRGHPDGILTHPLYPGRSWVADIKSMNAMIWNALSDSPAEVTRYLDTAEDRPWLLKYPPQVVSYILAYEQRGEHHDGGVLIFVNKDNSRIKLAVVEASEPRCRWVVERCRYINRCVREQVVPPFCPNPKLCELCPYHGGVCEPAVIVKGSTTVDAEDPQNAVVVAELRGYTERKAQARAFDMSDKAIKSRFKSMPPGEYVVDGVRR